MSKNTLIIGLVVGLVVGAGGMYLVGPAKKGSAPMATEKAAPSAPSTAMAVSPGLAKGEDAITYRQSVMKSIGGDMKAMATLLKGGGDLTNFQVHADNLAALAKVASTAFPENSSQLDGQTKAKDNIWSDADNFKKVLAALQTESAALATVAKTGDKAAIGAQLGKLGKEACKTCHDTYKEKN